MQELQEAMMSEQVIYDENTLMKIYAVLDKYMPEASVVDCINELQNAGILFRERPATKSSGNHQFSADLRDLNLCVCGKPWDVSIHQ